MNLRVFMRFYDERDNLTLMDKRICTVTPGKVLHDDTGDIQLLDVFVDDHMYMDVLDIEVM